MSNKLLMDGLYANRVYISEDFKETLDENFCNIYIERKTDSDKVYYKLYSNTNYMNTEQIFSYMSTNNSTCYYNNPYAEKVQTIMISICKKDVLQKLGKLREALYG